MSKNLSIYKASAGSGKTFRLTGEYIRLLFSNDLAYRHILAVTFTNKATAEMKQRILKELRRLSENPGNSPYFEEIRAVGRVAREQWSEQQIGEYARRVLIYILHDYSAFSVSTIDTFFQGVMRAFARELGKYSSYNVELDFNDVLSHSIDKMYAELDMPGHENLLKWLIDYSLELIDEEKSWKFKGQILELAKSLGSEAFKIKLKESGGMAFSDARRNYMESVNGLKANLNRIIREYEKNSSAIASQAMEIMGQFSLSPADFKGGQRSKFNQIAKVAGGAPLDSKVFGAVSALYNNLAAWGKKEEESRFAAVYNGGLNEAIGELVEHYTTGYTVYATARVVKGNMTALAILGDIHLNLLDYCRENNIVLLSETNDLLHSIIGNDDAPFVYEKTGTWVDHYMLDEFQDTSLLQWSNFNPLLKNSLANGMENLVVGDVKQSIYRWRNSDWSILESGIEECFKADAENMVLDSNYRSGSNIITFNNHIFEFLPRAAQMLYNGEESGRITSIYSGSSQKYPGGKSFKGAVSAQFVPVHNGNSDIEKEKIEYLENKSLVDTVRDLTGRGYSLRNIGILVRTNAQAAVAAQALMKEGFEVSSIDAFTLSSSQEVLQIVNILKHISDKNEASLKLFEVAKQASVPVIDMERIEILKSMPLYQMCEAIVRDYLSESQKKNLLAIQSFLDVVLEFTINEGDNISSFLTWWESVGVSKTMQIPPDREALQIISIHKSKGLAFDAVVLPYFELKFGPSTSRQAPRMWLNTRNSEIGYNAPLPVTYSSKLSETLFADDYIREKECLFIDSMNLAYVAFTRARKELHIISRSPKVNKNGEISSPGVSSLLYNYCTSPSSIMTEERYRSHCAQVDANASSPSEEDGESVDIERFVYGETNAVAGGDNVGKEGVSGSLPDFRDYSLAPQFILPLDSKRLETALQSGSISEELSIRDDGILMHDYLSLVSGSEDLHLVPEDRIRDEIAGMLESVKEREWFSGKYSVLNETDIILESGMTKRPDRVLVCGKSAIVIDYKFGEYVKLNRKYVSQIEEYIGLLKKVGFTDVKGYLWYVRANRIEEF